MDSRRLYTLVFVRNHSQILLGYKKRGFGSNRWNGFGGKVEKNESVLTGAARELKEECGLMTNLKDLKLIGHLEFIFKGDPIIMEVKVFSATIYEGIPVESEEMIPKWFDIANIPFNEMWPDDEIWFPYMLSGKKFMGKFWFEGYNHIINYELQEITDSSELLSQYLCTDQMFM